MCFLTHCSPRDYYLAAGSNDPNRKIMQIPLFLGAIAIFYVSDEALHTIRCHLRHTHVLYDRAHQNNNNGKIAQLKLDGCILVEIFSGEIKTWNDPRILQLNGGNVPAGKITVVHRRHGSSSTFGTTSYLKKLANDIPCTKKWPTTMNDGKAVSSTVGTNGVWFKDGSDIAAQGSSGVLAKLRSEG